MSSKGTRRGRATQGSEQQPVEASRKWLLATAVLSGVAAAVSGYLAYAHLRLHREVGFSSICAIGDRLSCDAVALSKWSSFAGLPVAAHGVWFYLVVTAIAVAGLRGNRFRFPRSPAAVLFGAGFLAVLVSVALGIISVTALDAVCPFCLVLHALNLALLGVGWAALRSTGETPREALGAEWRYWKRNQGRATVALGLPAVTLLGAAVVWPSGFAPVENLCTLASARRSIGDTKPVELVIYSDFQCPHCRIADGALERLRGNPRVKIDARQYPLDKECNPSMTDQLHAGACLQATAAICAAEQGKGPEMTSAIFERKTRDTQSLVELARSLGADGSKFEACLGSDSARQKLDADISAARSAGVKGTPTMFVDGRKYEGSIDAAALSCLTR